MTRLNSRDARHRLLLLLVGSILGAGGAVGQRPSWEANPYQYEASMTVVASLYLDGHRSSDGQDLLAAFQGGELRGVASPTLVGGEAFYFLIVYGDNATGSITFEAYDERTGSVVWLNEQLIFASNANLGTLSAPVVLTGSRPRQVPGTPTLLGPSLGASGLTNPITLSWSAATGSTSYDVQMATDAGFTQRAVDIGVDGTTHVVALEDGTVYFWRVRGRSGATVGEWSAVWTFATQLVVFVPGPPALASPVSGAVISGSAVNLSWGPVTGADSYRIQVATNASFEQPVVDAVQSGLAYNALLEVGRTYLWRVQALAGGVAGAWSSVRTFTTQVEIGAVVLVSPADGVSGIVSPVQFSWQAAAGATSYDVQLATDASFSVILVDANTTGIDQVATLPAGATFFWRIRGRAGAAVGPWSNANSFTTTSQTGPGTSILTAPAAGAVLADPIVNFTWEAGGGADSWQIQVATTTSFANPVADATGSTTSYVAALTAGQSYAWRVRGFVGGIPGAWSETRSFAIQVTVGTPTLLGPSLGASGLTNPITLSWSAATGSTSYDVQVATDAGFTQRAVDIGVDGTTHVVALEDGTVYFWRVRGRSGATVGEWSAVWTFATQLVVFVPDPPALASPVSGAVISGSAVNLSWGPVTGADSYRIQVATNAAFEQPVVDAVQSGLAYNALLEVGRTYLWRVQALAGGVAGAWSSVRTFTTQVEIGAVALVSPADGVSGVVSPVQFSWQTAAGATSYDVQLATDASFSVVVFESTVDAVSRSVTVLPGQAYFWRVRGRSGSATGPWSLLRSFITAAASVLPAPVLVGPPDGATVPATVAFSWLAVSGAASYRFQIASDVGFSSLVQDVSVTRVDREVVLAEGTYWWRVRGVSSAGPGAWSTVRTIRVELPTGLERGARMAFSLHQNFPNPFGGTSWIDFEISTPGDVEFSIADPLGRTVESRRLSGLSAGFHRIEVDAGRLQPGVYAYRLISANRSAVRLLTVVQ